ncbi:uncharacterized protein [Aegilops tauschii subsp. strangulata]|uniref:uncharacterized protein n=1 Tax=Aegilops tauschii subsp. strangulata TaxID=200361 RepID=UPI000989C9DB|nr:uncharacterized protein LOC109749913 [Aegilops tauschii subsp. strangulata]
MADTERLVGISEARGGQVCLDLLTACIGNEKNYPKALQGQYQGHVKNPTIILEVVASQDLWICHAFFGMPESCNDINVLKRSPLFARLSEGKVPPCHYTANGHVYNMGYYLVDGIYPSWSTFVNTISNPVGQKKAHFTQRQEAARMGVERAFGVLQVCFAVVRGPAKQWDQETLWVITCCVIMDNMIVEDEGEDAAAALEFGNMGDPIHLLDKNLATFEEFIQMHQQIRHRLTHEKLKEDLIEYQWAVKGDNNVGM